MDTRNSVFIDDFSSFLWFHNCYQPCLLCNFFCNFLCAVFLQERRAWGAPCPLIVVLGWRWEWETSVEQESYDPHGGAEGFWFRSSVRGQWQADDQWGGQRQAVTEAWAGGTQCGQSTGPTCNLRTTTLGRDCVPWLTPLAGLLLPPWGPRTCQALEGACANDRPWSIRLIASL